MSYIGVSNNVPKRMVRHRHNAKDSNNLPLYKSMREFGFDSFTCEIIDSAQLREDAYKKEMFYIKSLNTINNGFNTSTGGKGGSTGIPLSEERKKKLSELWTGRKFSEETKRKISIALTNKRPSEQTRMKQSAAKKGKPPPNKKKMVLINQIKNERIEICGWNEFKKITGVGHLAMQRNLYQGLEPRKNGKLYNFYKQGWRLQWQ